MTILKQYIKKTKRQSINGYDIPPRFASPLKSKIIGGALRRNLVDNYQRNANWRFDVSPLMSLNHLRQEYGKLSLSKSRVVSNPVEQFELWMKQAIKAGSALPNSMNLATIASDGTPDSRIMLLKGFDNQGFTFVSNYNSTKGQQLDYCDSAALVFWWPELERQVRIKGHVEKVSSKESDSFWKERPRGALLAACSSNQSQPIKDRKELDQKLIEITKKFDGQDVKRPKHWGGYRLKPHVFEFWQGRVNRFHDRIRYRFAEHDRWKIERLAP